MIIAANTKFTTYTATGFTGTITGISFSPGTVLYGDITAITLGTNYIDRADCESTTPPMVTPETVPLLSNATFIRSDEQKRNGSHSYKVVKTNAAGTGGWVSIVDSLDIVDLHGLIAGHTYTFELWVKVPSASGIALNEVFLQIADHQAGWLWSFSDPPTAFDTYQKLTATRTFRPSATGCSLMLVADDTADINEYYYVDDVRLHEQSKVVAYER